MENSSSKERLTLEEYLQGHKIRKKIEERQRSKSKNKAQHIKNEHKKGVKNIYSTLDRFLDETKLDLQQALSAKQLNKDKLFFHISKELDKLITIIKEEIQQLYKDVYSHLKIQNQGHPDKIQPADQQYFQEQLKEAKDDRKRKLGQVVKQNFKQQSRTKLILQTLVGKVSKQPSLLANQNSTQKKDQQNPPQEQPLSFMAALMGFGKTQETSPQPLAPASTNDKIQLTNDHTPAASKESPIIKGLFASTGLPVTKDLPSSKTSRSPDQNRRIGRPFERRPQPGFMRSPGIKQKK